MKIKKLNSQIEFVNNEFDFLYSNEEEVNIVVLEQTECIYGMNDSCNTDWCDKNNVKYVHQEKLHKGGCIVGVAGNIFIDAKIEYNKDKSLTDDFAKALSNYFREKGLDSVKCDNNDVMIDCYKVASGCETYLGPYTYMGYQISIYQDLETIKHACNKPMLKIPRGLIDYGITTSDIEEFCYSYWNGKFK